MRCLTEGVQFHEARNSRQKEQKSDVQMCCSLCVEYVELLSQKKSGYVFVGSTHNYVFFPGWVNFMQDKCLLSCNCFDKGKGCQVSAQQLVMCPEHKHKDLPSTHLAGRTGRGDHSCRSR